MTGVPLQDVSAASAMPKSVEVERMAVAVACEGSASALAIWSECDGLDLSSRRPERSTAAATWGARTDLAAERSFRCPKSSS